MLKTPVIIVVFFFVAQTAMPTSLQARNNVGSNAQEQSSSTGKGKHPAHAARSVSPDKTPGSTDEIKPEQRQGSDDHSTIIAIEQASVPGVWRWYEIVAWVANLLLVGVGIGTLSVVKRQTDHLVASERAWMIGVPDSPDIPEMSVQPESVTVVWHFINKGKTPAYLLEIGSGARVLPSAETLPEIPPASEEVEAWYQNGIPLLPEAEMTRSHCRIIIPKAIQLRSGALTLWVYGYIKYRDISRKERETQFCFRWEPVSDTGRRNQFIPTGPETYNRAT